MYFACPQTCPQYFRGSAGSWKRLGQCLGEVTPGQVDCFNIALDALEEFAQEELVAEFVAFSFAELQFFALGGAIHDRDVGEEGRNLPLGVWDDVDWGCLDLNPVWKAGGALAPHPAGPNAMTAGTEALQDKLKTH